MIYSKAELTEKEQLQECMSFYLEEFKEIECNFDNELNELDSMAKKIQEIVKQLKSFVSFEDVYSSIENSTQNILNDQEVYESIIIT